MKRSTQILLLTFSVMLAVTASVSAQTDTFSNPQVEYTFVIPEDRWKQVGTVSTTSPSPVFIFVDRSDGVLNIRKVAIKQSGLLTDLIKDEESRVSFYQGFIAGKEENIVGKYRGIVFNFEFVRNARQMTGRYYFLRSSDDTVYLLKFEGKKDIMRSIQGQMDSIARTFEIKK